MRTTRDHLTDDEIDAVLGTAVSADAAMSHQHLAACAECREAVARVRALYASLEQLPRIEELSPAHLAAQEHAIRRRLAASLPVRARRDVRSSARWLVLATSAAALLLIGVGLGRWSRLEEHVGPAAGTSSADPILEVQHTGSAYVAALARLGALPAGDDKVHRLGGEVALSTLYGAASEAGRLVPDDLARRELVDAARTARQAMIARTAPRGRSD